MENTKAVVSVMSHRAADKVQGEGGGRGEGRICKAMLGTCKSSPVSADRREQPCGDRMTQLPQAGKAHESAAPLKRRGLVSPVHM